MQSIARKMVNDSNVASDIVQEVFVYFLERKEGKKEIHNTGSWLLRATINKCIDHNERKKLFQNLDGVRDTGSADQQSTVDEKAVIRLALSKLKPREKTLAVLYSEGYSYRELSGLTGIRYSSVGKNLSRVLNKMKDELKNLNYELY